MKPIENYLIYKLPAGEAVEQWRARLNAETGMVESYWALHEQLFPRTPDGTALDDSGWVDVVKFRKFLWQLPFGADLNIGMESRTPYWNVYDPEGNVLQPEAIKRYAELVRWMRSENPSALFGFFNEIPRGGGTTIGYCRLQTYHTWRAQLADGLWEPAISAVDFLLPNVYPRSDWPLRRTLLSLERLAMGCRDYYPQKRLKFCLFGGTFVDDRQPIPRDYWRQMLALAYCLSDGVILFEGGGRKVEWDEDAPWWGETRIFLREEGVSPR